MFSVHPEKSAAQRMQRNPTDTHSVNNGSQEIDHEERTRQPSEEGTGTGSRANLFAAKDSHAGTKNGNQPEKSSISKPSQQSGNQTANHPPYSPAFAVNGTPSFRSRSRACVASAERGQR